MNIRKIAARALLAGTLVGAGASAINSRANQITNGLKRAQAEEAQKCERHKDDIRGTLHDCLKALDEKEGRTQR